MELTSDSNIGHRRLVDHKPRAVVAHRVDKLISGLDCHGGAPYVLQLENTADIPGDIDVTTIGGYRQAAYTGVEELYQTARCFDSSVDPDDQGL